MEINLSQRVKEICREKGITMKELAEKMKIAPESLSRAINGNPQLSTIGNIADALDVPLEYLFGSRPQLEAPTYLVYNGIVYTIENKEHVLQIVRLIGIE